MDGNTRCLSIFFLIDLYLHLQRSDATKLSILTSFLTHTHKRLGSGFCSQKLVHQTMSLFVKQTMSLTCFFLLPLDSRPLPDVAMTGKCTRECDEYGHSDSCWMPVRTSPERRPSKSTTNPQQPKLSTFMSGNSSGSSSTEQPGSQETLAMAAMANGDPTVTHMMGDRNRNLLNKKMASSSSYEAFGSPSYGSPSGREETLGHPTEEIPMAPTGEYKPTSCGTLTRREVYLWAGTVQLWSTTHGIKMLKITHASHHSLRSF